MFDGFSGLGHGGMFLWVVLGAVVGAVLLAAFAMLLHTNQQTKDPNAPRMSVREFVKGIRF